MGRSADEVFDIFRRIVNALKGRGAISDFASANGGSLNGGSQSSIGSNFSSQVSNGSADGTFTAIEELINDHIKHMRGRRRRERGGAEYINRLGELLSIVQTEKMKITARDSERDAAIVEVYHNMRDLFGKIAVTKPSPMSDDTLLSFMYSGFCNQLMDLQQSFLACMGTTNYSPEPEPEPEYEPEPRPLPPPPPPPRLEPTPTTWTEPVLTPPPPPKPRLAPEPKPNPKIRQQPTEKLYRKRVHTPSPFSLAYLRPPL
ncbi:hypothetical protein B0T14DRAFT_495871 [Immersiella caudata]|uniref:Uncharacterized protein n=1 Tax=Immersiella caudata TaxID=314043 RepID=A0AA40BZA6_9PEZI|nr:hypothetical protein B0T14DRAFT_495871 [Immersiella caudata]